MIVKMRKLLVLAYHKDYDQLLDKIKELGALHIKERDLDSGNSERVAELLQIKQTIKSLDRYLQKYVDKAFDAPTLQLRGADIVSRVELLKSDLEKTVQTINGYHKDLDQYLPWGDVNSETVDSLEKSGLKLLYYSAKTSSIDNNLPNLFTISEKNGRTFFVVVERDDVSEELTFDADSISLPSVGKLELVKLLEEAESKVSKLKLELSNIANGVEEGLNLYQAEIDSELDLLHINKHTKTVAESTVMVVEGFIPADSESETVEVLEKMGTYYQLSDPSISENIPVLLKNNRFTRLFETIGGMYSLPKYGEMDLTPYFAPFYWLFFGFCLGDAGYGLILMILGFFMRRKGEESTRSIFSLVMLLGVSTFIFGTVTGNVFGYSLFDNGVSVWGDFAKNNSTADSQFSINDHLFTLSLLLGAIQILFGMVIKIINITRQHGFRSAYSTAGWLTLFTGLILTSVVEGWNIPQGVIDIFTYTVLALWGLSVFIFNTPGRSILANIGAGLWDTYNMATGVVGDLLSYIRLFALGVSSSILAFVFNELAIQFAPDAIIGKVVVMTLILVVGHGITLFMSGLGSFVHPVRLTFVEFYKNAGFEGGGTEYKPWKRR